MSVVFLAGLAVLGLVVGGLLNTVIVRAPDDRSLLRPGPECPDCRASLGAVDVVPVLSYVRLRGRCRHCGEPVPAAYPLVEVGTAVLFVAGGIRFGASLVLIPYLVLFAALLAQSVIDLELYLLLDRITFPTLGALLVLVVAISAAYGELAAVGSALIGMVLYFVLLFVPALVYPKGMGFGDVKLAAPMGLMLGWLDPVLCLYALIVASVLGVVAGLALLAARRGRSEPFPFGPWLAAGCVVTILGSGLFA